MKSFVGQLVQWQMEVDYYNNKDILYVFCLFLAYVSIILGNYIMDNDVHVQ